jgi:hypothetical protein
VTHQTPEFAEYSHEKTDQSLAAVEVRTVAREDAAAVAELDAQRNLLNVKEISPSIQREVEAITEGDRRRYCCVAVLEETVIGYGKVSWIDVAATAGSQHLPSAWYLTGLVVSCASSSSRSPCPAGISTFITSGSDFQQQARCL